MKINRDKLSKLSARFGLIIMAFVIMIPMLCSASAGTYSVSYSLTNPDNIPQDITAGVDVRYSDSPILLNFGTGSIDVDSVVNVINGAFEFDGDSATTTLPNGSYLMCPIQFTQPSGYASTLTPVGGTDVTFTVGGNSVPCYLSDTIDLVVVERDNSLQLMNILIIFVPLTPTPTDSITNVWTGIMNWITSSLNTVQGIFITGGGGKPISTVLDLNDSVTVDGTTFYHLSPDYTGDLYYNGTLVDFSAVDFVLGDGYTVGYLDGVLMYYVPSPASESNLFLANLPSLTLTSGQPYQLTLLGTLAVIGVSISICFLLIGIIQRFLRLRG